MFEQQNRLWDYVADVGLQPQDLRVGNKYRIGRKIGSGSFGDIYLGTRSTPPIIIELH